MLHHHVMLTLAGSATSEQRDAIIDGLRALPDEIPGLESIEVSADAGLAEGNAHVYFHMTFRDEQSWREYTSHPAHVALAQEHIRPVLEAKTAIQQFD
ncbi:Dabb family protein [Nocardioides sp. GXZ039]|uniref:Dabb family protein n=1 Tax=Nocardioides sp. GXZ039 TaxID=3136018 RepID=UPI0030F37E6A